MMPVEIKRAGGKILLLCSVIAGLTACGQKGSLVLPSDQAANNGRVAYLIKPQTIKPKKANGEPEPVVQTDFTDQIDPTVNLNQQTIK